MPIITSLYAALLTFLLLALYLRIVCLRWKFRVGIGDGGEKILHKAIRAHGNFIETVPWAILLMFLIEQMQSASVKTLHIYGASLLIARCLHAYGLSRHSGFSWQRGTGVVLTLSVLLSGAVMCLWKYISLF